MPKTTIKTIDREAMRALGYGKCPMCGTVNAPDSARERSPDGCTQCGHCHINSKSSRWAVPMAYLPGEVALFHALDWSGHVRVEFPIDPSIPIIYSEIIYSEIIARRAPALSAYVTHLPGFLAKLLVAGAQADPDRRVETVLEVLS